MTLQTCFMKRDRPHVLVEICPLYHDHYQTMALRENLDPIDLRLMALRARRDFLKAKLQRIRKLEAKKEQLQEKLAWLLKKLEERQEDEKKQLQEQLAWLRQKMEERQEDTGSDSKEGQETREQ